jgi:hypothetical protein
VTLPITRYSIYFDVTLFYKDNQELGAFLMKCRAAGIQKLYTMAHSQFHVLFQNVTAGI